MTGVRRQAMPIAVLGAGAVGRAIGTRWVKAGHQVTYGVRRPRAPEDTVREDTERAGRVTTAGDALRDAEVVLLAVPADAVADVLALHATALDGRIVLDATNRLGPGPMHALDALTRASPHARLYRAFNHLGWENFAQPRFSGVAADLFYCGPQDETRSVVEQLIADVGLRPVRVGGLDSAELLDGITRLWFALALGAGHGRHLAFSTLFGGRSADRGFRASAARQLTTHTERTTA